MDQNTLIEDRAKSSYDMGCAWGIEFQPPRGRWILIGVVGSQAQADRWMMRLLGTGSGSWRIRHPKTKEVA